MLPRASVDSRAARRRNIPAAAQYTAISVPSAHSVPGRRAPNSPAPKILIPSAARKSPSGFPAGYRPPTVGSSRWPFSAISRAWSAIFSSQGSQNPNAPRRGRQIASEKMTAQPQGGTLRSRSSSTVKCLLNLARPPDARRGNQLLTAGTCCYLVAGILTSGLGPEHPE